MAAISRDTLPPAAADKDRRKYLTAKEVIGDVECEIVLEQDASGQYREVMLTPISTERKDRSF